MCPLATRGQQLEVSGIKRTWHVNAAIYGSVLGSISFV
jgi:hypothetical protein